MLQYQFNKILTISAIALVLMFGNPANALSQWNEVRLKGDSNGLALSDLIRFSGNLGYAFERSSIAPRLFVSRDTGKTWELKRFFFEISNSTLLVRDFFIKQNGNLLFTTSNYLLEMDTSSLLIDTVFKIAPNRTQAIDGFFKEPKFIRFGEDSIFLMSSNLFVSYNDGETWQRKNDFFVQTYRNFHFVNNQNGFFLGWTGDYYNLKVFTTANGGNTWDTVGEPLQSKAANKILFLSRDTGFLIGNSKCLYKTTDRGKTWKKWFCQSNNNPDLSIQEIVFLNSDVGWMTDSESEGLYKTVDGGRTYFPQALPSPTPSSIGSVQIISPSIQILSGSRSYRSTNQGGSPLLSTNKPKSTTLEKPVLYPNPVSNYFQITTQFEEPINIEILDVLGKKQMEFKNYSSEEFVDVSILPMGIYFAKLANGKTIKFLKE